MEDDALNGVQTFRRIDGDGREQAVIVSAVENCAGKQWQHTRIFKIGSKGSTASSRRIAGSHTAKNLRAFRCSLRGIAREKAGLCLVLKPSVTPSSVRCDTSRWSDVPPR